MLAIIGKIGVGGGTGHVIEFRGEAIRALDMDERMTVCNMSIEAGARAGMIAPDETTYRLSEGPPARAAGRGLGARASRTGARCATDEGAVFDREVVIDAGEIAPMITWGTHPGMVTAVTGNVPAASDDPVFAKALDYMGFAAGQKLAGSPINVVFIGSCTNSRLTDLRAAAGVLKGRKVAPGVQMLVVPGSQQIKKAAEAEGLDKIFKDAGAEWRESGCSMCLGMNGDTVGKGQYSVSTSNRNFEGRQGVGARTLLASPADGRGLGGARRHHRPARSVAGMPAMQPIRSHHLAHRGPAAHRYRHRPDHPCPLPAHHDARRPGQAAVRRLALSCRRHAESGVRAQQAGSAGLQDPGRRPQFRLRLVARARAVGAARFRHPRRDQHRVRRHLPLQLAEERSRAGDRRSRPAMQWLLANPGVEVTDRHRDQHRAAARWPQGHAFRSIPSRAICLMQGVDQLGYLLAERRRDHGLRETARLGRLLNEGQTSPFWAATASVPKSPREAVACLQKVAQLFGHEFLFDERDFGGIAIDRHGDPLPADTLASCLAS